MSLDQLITQVHDGDPDGTPLDHLTEAVSVAARLGEVADHLVGHFVDQARRSGASWTQIGQSMGMTKQAAQQRSVPGADAHSRFTNRAQVVVLKAETEARERGDEHVTGLHLLLGMAVEWEGFAGQAIADAGVAKDALVAAVRAELGPPGSPARRHVPFSPGLRKVHELAVRESLRLGHSYIGTEHVLLGLLEARDEPGAVLLAGLGVDKAGVERWTIDALASYAG